MRHLAGSDGRGWRRNRDVVVTVASAVTVFLAGETPAHANCIQPPPAIVWSYPTDGATGVPTNARIFVFTTRLGQETIFLNGERLEHDTANPRLGSGARLLPRTEYAVSVSLLGVQTTAPLGFRFTTGDGPAPAGPPPAPVVDRVTQLAMRNLSAKCTAVWQASGCYDTGQNTHLVFETAARPLLFFVLPRDAGPVPFTMPWPGECGHPEIYVSNQGGTACQRDYQIHAVSVTGEETIADFSCSAGPQPRGPGSPRTPEAGGCTVATGTDHGSLSFLVMAVAAALTLRRRRARSAAATVAAASTASADG
jgi:MYXO-CTERM domain-containing protein